MQDNVILGLGSNIGDRENNLVTAIKFMNSNPKIKVTKVSSVYESEPWGYEEQNNFFNMVIKISTDYNIPDLFNFVKKIESDLGRTKSIKWGPREIDIDILLYSNIIYKSEELTIPHKELQNRDFVLIPLMEIDKEFNIAGIDKKVSEINLDKIKKCIINKLNLKSMNLDGVVN